MRLTGCGCPQMTMPSQLSKLGPVTTQAGEAACIWLCSLDHTNNKAMRLHSRPLTLRPAVSDGLSQGTFLKLQPQEKSLAAQMVTGSLSCFQCFLVLKVHNLRDHMCSSFRILQTVTLCLLRHLHFETNGWQYLSLGLPRFWIYSTPLSLLCIVNPTEHSVLKGNMRTG